MLKDTCILKKVPFSDIAVNCFHARKEMAVFNVIYGSVLLYERIFNLQIGLFVFF
jgi:hypothetical protein